MAKAVLDLVKPVKGKGKVLQKSLKPSSRRPKVAKEAKSVKFARKVAKSEPPSKRRKVEPVKKSSKRPDKTVKKEKTRKNPCSPKAELQEESS